MSFPRSHGQEVADQGLNPDSLTPDLCPCPVHVSQHWQHGSKEGLILREKPQYLGLGSGTFQGFRTRAPCRRALSSPGPAEALPPLPRQVEFLPTLSLPSSSLTPSTESPTLSLGPSLCRAGRRHAASLSQGLAVGGPEPGTFFTGGFQPLRG